MTSRLTQSSPAATVGDARPERQVIRRAFRGESGAADPLPDLPQVRRCPAFYRGRQVLHPRRRGPDRNHPGHRQTCLGVVVKGPRPSPSSGSRTYWSAAADTPESVGRAATTRVSSGSCTRHELRWWPIAFQQGRDPDPVCEHRLFRNKAYGLGAAAARYYSTSADALNLNQAATLAGVLNAPSVFDPVDGPPPHCGAVQPCAHPDGGHRPPHRSRGRHRQGATVGVETLDPAQRLRSVRVPDLLPVGQGHHRRRPGLRCHPAGAPRNSAVPGGCASRLQWYLAVQAQAQRAVSEALQPTNRWPVRWRWCSRAPARCWRWQVTDLGAQRGGRSERGALSGGGQVPARIHLQADHVGGRPCRGSAWTTSGMRRLPTPRRS